MKIMFVRLLIMGAIFATCTLTGCGINNEETASEQVSAETVEPEVSSTPKVTSAPVSMQAEDTTTPSGVKVEANYQKYNVVAGANVRADCDGNSEWKGSLFAGNVVQGTGVCENGWIQILYNGEKCYVTGSCLEVTTDGEVDTGTGFPSSSPTATVTETPGATETVLPTGEATVTTTPEVTVDVTDWAKYTSSKWEASASTSCFVQIHSIAGNAVVFRFEVIDGSLDEKDQPDTTKAEVKNCNGKIENGIMNFNFTDDQGNVGVGRMEIVDDTHLSITTMITQPNPEATYKAEIMTELTEVE